MPIRQIYPNHNYNTIKFLQTMALSLLFRDDTNPLSFLEKHSAKDQNITERKNTSQGVELAGSLGSNA